MSRIGKFRLAGAALTVSGLLLCSVTFAGGLRLAPVRVYLDHETRAGMIELTNPGDAPISLQVDPFKWTQALDGEDEYAPTTEIMAFPTISTINPGETQLVRIGRLSEETSDSESAYRVYFTELSDPGRFDDVGASIAMRLRIGVPVFVQPTIPPLYELRIVSSEITAEGITVRLQNSGNAHVRVSEIFVPELADAEPMSAMKYILPGAIQEFSIPVPFGTEISTVHASSDQLGISEFDLETGTSILRDEVELASR
jgi:fimbrial chaperone protein